MIPTKTYAALDPKKPLTAFTIQRRKPGKNDVHIKIMFCGICHTDIHQARNEWGHSIFPMVPGHEIVGQVVTVGASVKKFKKGDYVGVGCMVDSCGTCKDCKDHVEQFCNTVSYTYNSQDPKTKEVTYGGYADSIVVNQKFVLRVSKTAKLAAVAPLLCAGITTYSPLKKWKVQPGQKVGVVGLGGLGHMAVKIAKAMKAHVVVFTTSNNKSADAKRLGAKEVIISNNANEMAKHALSFDFILDTVAASHDIDQYLNLLKRDGTMCLVGVPNAPHPAVNPGNLVLKRRQLVGSLIGGIKETQEMLDFCAKHKIVSDIETIPINYINTAYERMLKSDVKYRFVIDMKTI
jgi:alcohol dehydrogenase (NADP+)